MVQLLGYWWATTIRFILQQLNQRRADKNFIGEVRLVDQADNMLAAYLAEYGARNWKEMVIIEEPFGRVEELWHYDMGLGYFGPRFRAVLQGEVNPAALADEVVNPPNEAVNQGDVAGPMEVENVNNGMEVLAASAAMNNDAQNAVGDNNAMVHEVVIGLAAVPLEEEGDHVLMEGGAQNEL